MMKLFIFTVTLWLLLLLTNPVYAYLDPGTGSMLLQAMLAALAAVAVVFRIFWNRIRGLFRSRKKKE